MARGEPVRDDLIALLRAAGQTSRSTSDLAAQLGVSQRTANYAVALLRDEGLIVQQWEGPNDRTIVWVGPDADKDEAQTAADSRVPASA